MHFARVGLSFSWLVNIDVQFGGHADGNEMNMKHTVISTRRRLLVNAASKLSLPWGLTTLASGAFAYRQGPQFCFGCVRVGSELPYPSSAKEAKPSMT